MYVGLKSAGINNDYVCKQCNNVVEKSLLDRQILGKMYGLCC